MNLEETDWATRWDEVRQRALADPALPVVDSQLGDLAQRIGLKWFDRLHRQRAGDYLERDGRAIVGLPGFGSTKRERLIAIIEMSLQHLSHGHPVTAEPVEACERLVEWGVPHDYPVAALHRLPTRVFGFCEESRIESLGELVRAVMALGEDGLLSCKNLGRKSVADLIALVDALRRSDRQEAARWLPLSESGHGLSLGVAIKQLIADLDARQRPMLELRLVQGMTLEDAARMFQVTRERVRQVARDSLLGPLQRLLETFPEGQKELFQRWMSGLSPADHLGAFATSEDRALADGALCELFVGHPEAVAARLDQEMRFQQLWESMRRLVEFNLQKLDLQSFLGHSLHQKEHAAFMEYILNRGGVAISHDHGFIGPEKPSLRRLVGSLLEAEDEAIPATWLLRMVQQARAFEALTMQDLEARCRSMAQYHAGFPLNKVIWNE
jgi:hypothetical protein